MPDVAGTEALLKERLLVANALILEQRAEVPEQADVPELIVAHVLLEDKPQRSSGGTHPGQDDLWKIHMTA